MNESDRVANRLIELLGRGWDGTLTEADNAEINALLAEHGTEYCEVVLRASAIHLVLSRNAAAAAASERALSRITELAKSQSEGASHAEAKSVRPTVPLWSQPRTYFAAVAVTAAILVGLPLLPRTNEGEKTASTSDRANDSAVVEVDPARAFTRPPGPVATFAAEEKAVWPGEALAPGAVLREGDSIELLSGEVQLSVGFGAEILATGPFSLTFLSPSSVRLNHGNIAVQVAEWAKGFTVETSAMDVVDLGTTFTVSASPDDGVETRVLKGLVRVHLHESDSETRRGLLVSEGGSYLVDEQGRRWRAPTSKSATDDAINFGELAPYHPVELHNTGLGIEVGDEDPNWQIVSGPAGSTWPQFATVCANIKGEYNYLPNDPQASQWVSIANWDVAKARAVFTFQTSFNLSGYDLSTIQLFGRFLVDNGVREVRVNGQPVEFESWNIENYFGDDQFRFVNVSEGLVAGENVIQIDVWNNIYFDERSDTTPMALRVEWYAFGRQLDAMTASGE